MILPNFLVIGAAKSGTTSLHYYLKDHPQIYLPKIKEVNYFAYNGQTTTGYWAKSLKEYSAFFNNVNEQKAIGEVTPYYLPRDYSARLIKSTIPNVKLIAILRNPVDRAYSHYLMSVRGGKVSNNLHNAWDDISINYLNEGFYYKHLLVYYSLFQPQQLKIFLYDELKTNPKKLITELYHFLEVDDSFLPDLSIKHAKGYQPKIKFLNSIINSKFIRFGLKPILPTNFIKFGIKIKSINSSKPQLLPESIKQHLKNIYLPDILHLQDLIDKNLSHWIND